MEFCFKHKDVNSIATCPYCAKTYCADCLLLHGPRQVVICTECFSNISARIDKSIKRRKLYIAFGLPVAILAFLYGLVELYANNARSTLFVLIGLGCFVATGVNWARIKQFQ